MKLNSFESNHILRAEYPNSRGASLDPGIVGEAETCIQFGTGEGVIHLEGRAYYPGWLLLRCVPLVDFGLREEVVDWEVVAPKGSRCCQ